MSVEDAQWVQDQSERLALIRAFLAILSASDERREDAIMFLVIVLRLMRV